MDTRLHLMKFLLILSDDNRAKGSGLAPWPARLTTPPPRLADFGYSNEMFEKDTVIGICNLFSGLF